METLVEYGIFKNERALQFNFMRTALLHLPNHMIIPASSPAQTRGPQVEGWVKDDVSAIVAAVLAMSPPEVKCDTEMRPDVLEATLIAAMMDAVYDEERLCLRERAKVRLDTYTAYVGFGEMLRKAVAIWFALQQRLGLVNIQMVSQTRPEPDHPAYSAECQYEISGLSQSQVVDMLAFNALLVYDHASAQYKPSSFVFSKAPIRRWGFCNHFEHLLTRLDEVIMELLGKVDISQNVHVIEDPAIIPPSNPSLVEGKKAGLEWMSKLHTCFLQQYWEMTFDKDHLVDKVPNPLKHELRIVPAAIRAVEWYRGKVEEGLETNLRDLIEVQDLSSRRLANWEYLIPQHRGGLFQA